MPQETDTPATTETINVTQSKYCRELRSKRYYFLQQMPTEEHHLLDNSNRCWCRLTMQCFGPDGELVRPNECTPERGCYKSYFDE